MRRGSWIRSLPVSAGLVWALPWAASAQQIVIDWENVAIAKRQEEQLDHQAQELGRIYAKQIVQLATAVQQRDAMLGARGMGELLNTPQDRAARRPAPATFEELLRSVAEGQQIPSTYGELRLIQERIRREVPIAGVKQVYGPNADTPTGRAYDRSQRTAVANLALAEKSYHDATARVETYEKLLEQIDRTPDLKASTDLVARLLVENGVATNELIRLNALLLAGAASEQAGALAARSNLSGIARTAEKKAAPAEPRVEAPPVFRGVLR
jgi:hypothetical protein